jgi:hypothetical protein
MFQARIFFENILISKFYEYMRLNVQSAFHEKVPAGCCWFRRKVYWWVDYRAAIGGKQYDAPGSYTATYRLKTSSS